MKHILQLWTGLVLAVSLARANLIRGIENTAGNRNLDLNWLGEEWFGHDPDDRPSLLVLQRDPRLCLGARNVHKKTLQPEPKLALLPGETGSAAAQKAGGDIVIIECDPDDTAQHFFLERWERWRPADNLRKCVDITHADRIKTGVQLALSECLKKQRGARWQINEYDEIMPFESSAFCVMSRGTDGDKAELGVCENGQRSGFEMIFPEDYDSYLENFDDDISLDSDDEPYVLIISNDDDWDSDEQQPKRKCLTANSNREAVMSKCDLSRSRQLWLIEESAKSVKKGLVRLRPKHNLGLCLYMSGELSNAYNWRERPVVRLKDCEKLFEGSEKQQWTIEGGYIHPQSELDLCVRKGEGSGDDKDRFASVANRCNLNNIWHFVSPADYTLPSLPANLLETGDFFRIEWFDQKDEQLICLEHYGVDRGRKCQDTDKFGRDSRRQLWYMDSDAHLRPVDRLHNCLEYAHWGSDSGSDSDDNGDRPGLKSIRRGNCASYKPYQEWKYDKATKSLSPVMDPSLCLTAKLSMSCSDDDISFGLTECFGWESQQFSLNRHNNRCRETIEEALFLVNEPQEDHGNDQCAVERVNGKEKWIRLDDCDLDDKKALWVMENEQLKPLFDKSGCLEVSEDDMPFAPPRLKECEATKKGQLWDYDDQSRELSPRNLPDFCLTSGCAWDWSQGICLARCGSTPRRQRWAITKTSEYVPKKLTTPKTRYYVVSKDPDCGCFCCLQINEEGVMGVDACHTNISQQFRQREWRKESRDQGFVLRKGSGCLTLDEEDTRDCDEDNEKQVWRFNDKGNNEIAPVADANICLSRSMKAVRCTGKDDQAWELVVSDEAPFLATERCDLSGGEGFILLVLEEDPRFCISSLGRNDGAAIKLTACDPSSYEQLWGSENAGVSQQLRPLNNLETCMTVNGVDYLQAVRIDDCREDESDSDDGNDYSTREHWLINEKGKGEISPALNPELCVSYDTDCVLEIEFDYMLGLVSCGAPEKIVRFAAVAPEDYAGM